MKLKDGVVMHGLGIEMVPIIFAAEQAWKDHGEELVITSALDGKHSKKSKHYHGHALDFRTWYFTVENMPKVMEDFKKVLTNILKWNKFFNSFGEPLQLEDYDIVLESTHLHVEYDPK